MTRRNVTMPINKDDPLDEKFEKLVKETLELWHVPGVAVAVVDGENTWSKVFSPPILMFLKLTIFSGLRHSKLSFDSVTPTTLFYTGSTTKAFTAAVMTLLVDDNEKYPEIQWTTPLAHLIRDDFVLENDYATTHITVEDALSHRSGLPGHDWAYGGHNTTIKDIVRSLRHLPMTAEPRTKYQYCNAMFITASCVIETVTGRKLGDLMREWVWEPLGMDATFFDLKSAKNAKEDLANGYRYRYDSKDGGFEEVEWMHLEAASGAGAVISNVLDYTKWARAIINQQTPLSEAGVEAMFTPRTLIPIEEPYTGPRAYALGWRTGVYRGQRFFEHSGGVNGFAAELLIFPDIKFSVVALANTAGTSNFVDQKLAFHLVDEKLKVPIETRFNWNKKYHGIVSQGKHKARNAKPILYPSLPNTLLPLPLPLAPYAGTYHHPAYQTLTIFLDSSSNTLRADRVDQILTQKLTFEHVSGDYFIVRAEHVSDFGALFPDVYPVEFRIGADGKVSEVGIGWEEEMRGMEEEKIWLRRVEE